MAYWKALDEVSRQGGADKATRAMKETMTGGELKLQVQAAKRWREEGIKSTRMAEIADMTVALVNLEQSPKLVKLNTCLEFSKGKTTRSGEPVEDAPDAFEERVEIHLHKGRWKVAAVQNEVVEACK